MQWIKANLSIVITSTLALIGIVMLVLGMFMSTVSADLQADQSVLMSLRSVQPVNAAVIDHEKEQLKKNQERLARALKELEATGNHEPLVPDVFPQLDATKPAPYTFKSKFREKQQQLLDALRAMDEPSKLDFDREANWLDEQKRKAERERVLGVDSAGGRQRTPAPAARPANRPPVRTARNYDNLSPEERLREDPAARVSVRRAHQIYCYAGLANLDQRPAITNATGLPSVDDMWFAQMSLWIQQDLLGAIAQLNSRAAEQLPEEDRWVGNLPVKRLLNIAVGGYLPVSAAVPGVPGIRSGSGLGDPAGVFTQRGSTGKVDTIHLVLELVLDAQRLPLVLDEICKTGFYTPLNVTYESLSPNGEIVGPIYGAAPVIKTRIEIEGCFLRSKYEKWMPPSVVSAIAEGRAGGSRLGGTGGGDGGLRPVAPGPRPRFSGS